MGINSHFTWVLIDPVMKNQLQQNVGLTLDADLILLLDVELIVLRLDWNAELTGSH